MYFLVISTSSIFIIGKFSWYETKNAIIDRTYQQLRSIRTEKEKILINFFREIEKDADFLAYHLTNQPQTLDNAAIHDWQNPLLTGYLSSKNQYTSIKCCLSDSLALLFENQTHTWTISHNHNCPQEISPANAIDTQIQVIDTLASAQNQLIIFKKLNLTAYPKAHILLYISHQTIDELIFSDNPHNGLGKSGEVYLVGDDYRMRSSSRFIKNASYAIEVKTDGVIQAFNLEEKEAEILDYRKIPVLSSFKKINLPYINWVILAEIDYQEATSQLTNIENNIIYLSIVISLLLLGVIAVLSTSITSPIRKLQQATEKVAMGEFTEISPSTAKDEIADLIRAFNSMNHQLQEQKERLEYEQVIKSTLVIDSQEEERQRLSRELHDSLGQSVLAIKLKIENLLRDADEKHQAEIQESLSLIGDTIREIRVISNNLMPSVLQQYGLVTAIENFGQWIRKDCHCQFTFNHTIDESILSKKTEIFLFRIIQEAFNNSMKHGKADLFTIHLSARDTEIQLHIHDNGKGASLDPNTWKKGNGLNNMRERVNLLSGTIQFNSAPTKGFEIQISIPS